MRASLRRRRGRAAFLLLYGALLLWQVDRWLFTPYGVVSTWDEEASPAPLPAASGGGLSQTFRMNADGLDGVWLRPLTEGPAPVHGVLVADLHEVQAAGRVRLTRIAVPAAEAAARSSLHVPLPPVRHSRGRTYQLDLRHMHHGAGPSLAFQPSRDDHIASGRLWADHVEQWGDLALQTTARRATLPYWIHEVLGPWPPWVQAWPAVVAVLLAFNVALARACALAVRPDTRPDTPRDGPVTVRHAHAHPPASAIDAARVARGVVSLLVIGGLATAVWPVPRHRTLDLIDHLPDAQITTTWPSLHAGVARGDVVFAGRVYRSIHAMPTTRIAWTVDVPDDAVLLFGAAMRADMWERESDGITMDVVVEQPAGRQPVAHYTLVPMIVPAHKNLHPGRVLLDAWAGQRVTIAFETTPERWGNAVNDVPVWVEPRIEWPRGVSADQARVHRAGK